MIYDFHPQSSELAKFPTDAFWSVCRQTEGKTRRKGAWFREDLKGWGWDLGATTGVRLLYLLKRCEEA
jgi:hypothetical protein